MKKYYLLILALLVLLVQPASAQSPSITRLDVSRSGTVSLFASFQDSIWFSDRTIYGGASPDVIIAQTDSDLNLKWHKLIGGWPTSSREIYDAKLQSDDSGNLYVAVLFAGTLQFDTGVLVYSPVVPHFDYGLPVIALAKYDSIGQVVWYTKTSLLSSSDDKVVLGVDSAGCAYLSGSFMSSLSINSDTLWESLTGEGTFMTKFSTDGVLQWLTGVSGFKKNNDGVVDKSGNLFVAGTCTGFQLCGPDTTTVSGGSIPSLVAGSSSGAAKWQRLLDGPTNFTQAVGVGPNESPVIGGGFRDTLGFNSLPPLTSTLDSAAFVAAYSHNGDEKWAISAENIIISRLVVNDYNDCFLSGEVQAGSVSVDGTVISTINGGRTIIRLDSNGNMKCHVNFANVEIVSMDVGPGGLVYVAGQKKTYLGLPYPFWSTSILGNDTLIDISNACVFIAALDSNCQVVKIDTVGSVSHPTESVGEIAAKSLMTIYPNPAAGKVNVAIDVTSFLGCALVIRNLQGKIVQSQGVESENVQVDVNALAPGLYTIECVNGSERIVEKFVKR